MFALVSCRLVSSPRERGGGEMELLIHRLNWDCTRDWCRRYWAFGLLSWIMKAKKRIRPERVEVHFSPCSFRVLKFWKMMRHDHLNCWFCPLFFWECEKQIMQFTFNFLSDCTETWFIAALWVDFNADACHRVQHSGNQMTKHISCVHAFRLFEFIFY